MAHRNVYLKIVKIPGYNPVKPPTMLGVNSITVQTPPDEFVAPAGYYMLVIMTPSTCLPGDHNHSHCGPVPSVGKWLRLTAL